MKALVVEDDTKTVGILVEGLEESGWTVETAENGKEGLIQAGRNLYDVIITDLMMPEMDGLEMISQLRNDEVHTPVLVLSAKDTVDDKVKALKEGGDDYMVKPFAMAELIVRLEVLTRRSDSERVITYEDLEVDTKSRSVKRANGEIELQPREYALLEYLLKRQGKLVTRKMIVENVWNYSFFPSTNIVDSRICRLRRKIDGDYDKKLIHTVRGGGYTLRADG
ncbi:MAG: response regulator transcription factor [Lentisphaeraceae bacterium]|nr:response regulator transcription factor [Lentisphaeraceae bacterium]